MAFKMPKKLEYGEYVVTIHVIPREAIDDQDHGQFDPVTRRMDIAKDLRPAERRWVYLHEKGHADKDYELWFQQNFSVKAPEGAEFDPTETADDDEVPPHPQDHELARGLSDQSPAS